MENYDGRPIYKVVFMCREDSQLDKARAALEEEFLFCCQTVTKPACLNGELINRKFDKGKGIQRLCAHLGWISGICWEVKECKRACQAVMKELKEEGIPFNPETEIGIMIETPASVFIAEELAKHVDFFSVGTNDLTQYTLACDRQCNDLGKFLDPHHPAVLRAIKMAADAAHANGIWIGVCGELGADLSLLPTFLAMGLDELSVTPSAVLPLRAEIRKSIAKTCTLEMLEC